MLSRATCALCRRQLRTEPEIIRRVRFSSAAAASPPPPPPPLAPPDAPPNLVLADWTVLQPKPQRPSRNLAATSSEADGDLEAGLRSFAATAATTQQPPPSLTVWVRSLSDPSAKLQELTLDADVFGQPVRRDVVHEVIRWQRAKLRQNPARTKGISEVSGSGRKVRPQKKSGSARAGHSRPPHWRKGAKAHGPRPRDWNFKLNRKYVKLGLKVALSARLREGCLSVVQDLNVASAKTGALESLLRPAGWERSTLFLDGEALPELFDRASRNMVGKGVKALPAAGANVFDVVKRERLVLTVEGVLRLQETLKLESAGAPPVTAAGEAEAPPPPPPPASASA